MERFVVIGGDAGGMSAAAQARRMRGPDELDIVAFERGHVTSYSACGLPYFVGGEIEQTTSLVARSPDAHRAKGIDVRVGKEVVAINPAEATIDVLDLVSGVVVAEPYDELLIATGASPVRPPFPGIDAEGVFDVRTIPDAVALDATIRDGARRAVVVGAGYIGLEIAEALIARGLEVTIVEKAPQPMLTMDPDMGARVADAVRALGIDLRLGVGVKAFEVAGGSVRAVLTDAGTIPAELVVLGLGVRPNTDLARDAGLAIGATGGVTVDRRQRTSAPRVWAAGDCAESFHRVSRRFVSIALGTHANKQGRVAGTNIGGGNASFDGVVGTAITRIGAMEVARTGLSTAEGDAAGFVTVSTTIDAHTRAQYYPGSEPITVKLIAERATGRLVGGQIIGGLGAGKRIDTVAIGIWNEMTAEEFGGLDLAYAPPFSPVWDPVLLAAGRLESMRRA